MPTNTEKQAYNHFVIPAKPDFFEVDLQLSEASKALFAKGAPGQGFVGLVDLQTNLIHLFPAFNKDDGQLRLDKEGKKFAKLAETAQSLGGGAGDLHLRTAGTLGLGDKAGNKQNLMGFGIWKGGQSVKFLEQMPENNLRLIADEYLVVKDENNQWKICYVDHEKKVTAVALNEAQKEALAALPTNVPPEKISFNQRKTIIDTLNINDPGNIKVIKNRSSSQNMFSCKYLPVYGEFFSNMMPKGHSGSHQVALQRELPLPVLSKIVNSVCEGLNLPLEGNYLEHSSLVPLEENDNRLRYHLEVESFWISLQNVLKALNAQTSENCQFIAKYFNQIDRTQEPASKVREFIHFVQAKLSEGELDVETFLLMIKHQNYYVKMEGAIKNQALNNLIERHFSAVPGVRNIILSTIEQNIEKPYEEIMAEVAESLIQIIKSGDLKVNADNYNEIAQFVLHKISSMSLEKKIEYWNFVSRIRTDNNIDSIDDSLIQQSVSKTLEELYRQTQRSSDATDSRKALSILENQGFIKSNYNIMMVHFLKYYDDYKKAPSFNKLTEHMNYYTNDTLYFRLVLENMLKSLKEANANEPYKALIRELVSFNRNEAFNFLDMLESDDWPALHEVLKEVVPLEYAVYSTFIKQLNISRMEPLFGGSDFVKYSVYSDFKKGVFSLHISPPGKIEYGYDGAISATDTRNFKESLDEVLAKLKDLGFPQETIDKVNRDLSANVNASSYEIDLDQAMQLAIFEKNQEKPAVEKDVETPKAQRRKSLLLSDNHLLSIQDKENASPNQSAPEVSTVQREKPKH